MVCKRNCVEDEKHFLIDCTEYESLRQQLYFHISENDATFINLTDHDRTLYLLRLDNDKTSHIVAKYYTSATLAIVRKRVRPRITGTVTQIEKPDKVT